MQYQGLRCNDLETAKRLATQILSREAIYDEVVTRGELDAMAASPYEDKAGLTDEVRESIRKVMSADQPPAHYNGKLAHEVGDNIIRSLHLLPKKRAAEAVLKALFGDPATGLLLNGAPDRDEQELSQSDVDDFLAHVQDAKDKLPYYQPGYPTLGKDLADHAQKILGGKNTDSNEVTFWRRRLDSVIASGELDPLARRGNSMSVKVATAVAKAQTAPFTPMTDMSDAYEGIRASGLADADELASTYIHRCHQRLMAAHLSVHKDLAQIAWKETGAEKSTWAAATRLATGLLQDMIGARLHGVDHSMIEPHEAEIVIDNFTSFCERSRDLDPRFSTHQDLRAAEKAFLDLSLSDTKADQQRLTAMLRELHASNISKDNLSAAHRRLTEASNALPDILFDGGQLESIKDALEDFADGMVERSFVVEKITEAVKVSVAQFHEKTGHRYVDVEDPSAIRNDLLDRALKAEPENKPTEPKLG